MFTIKFATKNDFKYIENIKEKCNLHYKDNYKSNIFMIAKDEIPFGYISMSIKDDIANIESILILPEYRNHGYGNMMVRLILTSAYERGVKSAYVNIPSLKNYFKFIGFNLINNDISIDLKKLFKN